MLTPEGGSSELLTPDVLASIGLDLLLSGESCWHLRVQRGEAVLIRVAYWDQFSDGSFHLHIPRVSTTETVKALPGEVVKLTINSPSEQPWRGRSPFAFMGLTSELMAEVEQAVSGALRYAGKGLLPMPATIPEEQRAKAISGLRGGNSLTIVTSKQDFGHQTGGDRSELKRVDLTPDLRGMEPNTLMGDLHNRILGAAGIPPSLFNQGGNAGAIRETYRFFALETMAPLARIILPELTRKLGVTKLNLDDMMSADVAGRARAVSTLTGSGVPLQTAMALVGWHDVSLTTPTNEPGT